MIDNYLLLLTELKAVKYEVVGALRMVSKKLGKETGRIGNKLKNWDHTDYNTVIS